MANNSANETSQAEFLPPHSRDLALAPWAGRRMYASGHPGAKVRGSSDESEDGHNLGVAETAMWGSFLSRIIKKQPERV